MSFSSFLYSHLSFDSRSCSLLLPSKCYLEINQTLLSGELKLKYSQTITYVFVTQGLSPKGIHFFFSALSFSLKNKTVLILVLHVISFSSIVVQISATIMLAPMYETMEPSQLALLRMHFILQTILTTLPIQVFQVCVPGPRNFICI